MSLYLEQIKTVVIFFLFRLYVFVFKGCMYNVMI